MKLEYKILWLDDEIQAFIDDEYLDELENHISSKGFISNIQTVKKASELYKHINDSYDLILTDYHMREENGDKVISKIRKEYSIFTEILFYTAKADLTDAEKIDRVSFLETKSAKNEHYQKVIDKIKTLIDLTVKKFEHIVSMRGMIIQETSSLDVEMENTLIKLIESSENSQELVSEIKAKYIDKNKEFNQEINDSDNLKFISLKIGASHRWRALKRNLPKGEIKTILNDYENEIISIRNKFAHAVLQTDKNGRAFFKYKEDGIDFNEEFCKVIRQNIIKHKNNLDKVKKLFLK